MGFPGEDAGKPARAPRKGSAAHSGADLAAQRQRRPPGYHDPTDMGRNHETSG